MREYSIEMNGWLNKGLRPEYRNQRNEQFLLECLNFRPTESGLEALYNPINPFIVEVDVSWPFPQLFFGAYDTICAHRKELYLVDEDWALSSIGSGIVEGGIWQFIDLHKSWVLLNGECVVVKYPYSVTTGGDDSYLVYDNSEGSTRYFLPRTGCYHKGRVVWGGPDAQGLWSDSWDDTVWDVEDERIGMYASQSLPKIRTVGSNFVAWSSIGGGDVFLPFIGTDSETWLEYVRRNEAGFMPMPWSGSVMCTKPLGRGVAIYGTNGISAIVPYSEPVATYGLIEIPTLERIGIPQRGAVGGDAGGHVFLGTDGSLWTLSADFQARRLGYREYVKDMVDSDILFTYDHAEGDHYLSDGTHSFLLNGQGLCQVGRAYSSIFREDANLYAVGPRFGNNGYLIETDIFDFGLRGLKTVKSVQLGCSVRQVLRIAIRYRYSRDDNWRLSDYVPINDEGVAFINITAADFRLVIEGFPGQAADTNIDYIQVTYQAPDKRARRGTSVSQAAA